MQNNQYPYSNDFLPPRGGGGGGSTHQHHEIVGNVSAQQQQQQQQQHNMQHPNTSQYQQQPQQQPQTAIDSEWARRLSGIPTQGFAGTTQMMNGNNDNIDNNNSDFQMMQHEEEEEVAVDPLTAFYDSHNNNNHAFGGNQRTYDGDGGENSNNNSNNNNMLVVEDEQHNSQIDDRIARLQEKHRQELKTQKEAIILYITEEMEKKKEAVKQNFEEKIRIHEEQVQQLRNEHEQEISQLKTENAEMKQKLKDMEIDALQKYQIEKATQTYHNVRDQLRQILSGGFRLTEDQRKLILNQEKEKYEEMGAALKAQFQLQETLHFNEKCKFKDIIESLTREKETLKGQLETANKSLRQAQGTVHQQQQHLRHGNNYTYIQSLQDNVNQGQQQIQDLHQKLQQATSGNAVSTTKTDNVSQQQLKEMEDKYEKEIEKLHTDRLEEMKGCNRRMEKLGTTIKRLTVQNREKQKEIDGLKQRLQRRMLWTTTIQTQNEGEDPRVVGDAATIPESSTTDYRR